MRISDWSSDVCSSDLLPVEHLADLVLAGELDVGDGDAVAIANEGGDDLGIGEGGAVTVLHQGVFDFVHAAGDVVQQHQGEVDRGGRPRQDTAEGEGGREGPDHHACHDVFLSCGKSAKTECNPSGLATDWR